LQDLLTVLINVTGIMLFFTLLDILQCFDAVIWVMGRASSLWKFQTATPLIKS